VLKPVILIEVSDLVKIIKLEGIRFPEGRNI